MVATSSAHVNTAPENRRPFVIKCDYGHLPQTLRDTPRWGLWRHELNAKTGKWVKTPINARTLGHAMSNNPSTWATFDDAYDTWLMNAKDYDGLAFFLGDGFSGIDLDDCYDVIGGFTDFAQGVIEMAEGYAEISPSGTGVKIYVRGEFPAGRNDTKRGIEVYSSGRFFAVTGRAVGTDRLNGVSVDLLPLYQKYFDASAVRIVADVSHDPMTSAEPPLRGITAEDIRDALDKLDPDMTEPEWMQVIRAVYHQTQGSDEGFEIVDAWSANGAKYDADAMEERWGRIKIAPASRATTFATVLKMVADAEYDGKVSRLEAAKLRIAGESERRALYEKIPRDLAREELFTDLDRDELAQALKARIEEIFKTKVDYRKLRKLLIPERPSDDDPGSVLRVQYPNTEFGNAKRLYATYGARLLHTAEDDGWYKWTDVYWKRTPRTQIEKLARRVVDSMPASKDGYDGKALVDYIEWCGWSQKAGMISSMVNLLRTEGDVMVPFERLDGDPMLLGVGNGAVDLRDGSLLRPDPKRYITVATAVEYDPEAQCPLFERVLSDAFFGDAEMIGFMHRLLGYSLLGNPKHQIIAIPWGGGSNGKSTILGAVQRVLGAHAKTTSASTFLTDGRGAVAAAGPNEALLRLRGSRFVYMSEPESGMQLRTSLIKSVTGSDVVSARGVHAKHSVEFRPTWVTFMPTNHKPIIKDDDDGIWRRVLLIPFLRNFDRDPDIKRDTDLEEKLKDEAQGILAWLVRGCIEYQSRGDLDVPRSVREAGEDYRTDMDVLADWLDEEWELDPMCGDCVSNGELWASWEAYGKRTGTGGFIGTQQLLVRKLKSRGWVSKKTTKTRGFVGIRKKGGVNDEILD